MLKMKCIFRFILLITLILLLCTLLVGCPATRSDISLEEVVQVYNEAGYSVWSEVYDEPLDDGQIAAIQANHPNGDYIYFTFFTNNKEAKAYKKEYYHPVTMSLFSVIYGDPQWPLWKVYGCIVIEYDYANSDFLKPFNKLRYDS